MQYIDVNKKQPPTAGRQKEKNGKMVRCVRVRSGPETERRPEKIADGLRAGIGQPGAAAPATGLFFNQRRGRDRIFMSSTKVPGVVEAHLH
ncbi:hypothetical protein [Desulfobulbus elongatus]|uniref:hypothetical protein n=1 Tax=Desulfobulbus elongatus TaxID=53332 RepID=UPI00146FB441|nr:hypothetical protein [Desulfobulbus elongatus]